MADSVAQQIGVVHSCLRKMIDWFPQTVWERIEPAPEAGQPPLTCTLGGNGVFSGLALRPGEDWLLRTSLDVPAEAGGVALAGEPLEGTLFSLYPTRITHKGRALFDEGGVPVASGPARFEIVPRLREGDNGPIELRICVPKHQVTNWFNFRLNTPSQRASSTQKFRSRL